VIEASTLFLPSASSRIMSLYSVLSRRQQSAVYDENAEASVDGISPQGFVTGPSTVVEAMASGKKSAQAWTSI